MSQINEFNTSLKNALIASIQLIHIETSEWLRLEASILGAITIEARENNSEQRKFLRYSLYRSRFYLWHKDKWVHDTDEGDLNKINQILVNSLPQALDFLRDEYLHPFVLLLDDLHPDFSNQVPTGGLSPMKTLREFVRLKRDKVPEMMRKTLIISGKSPIPISEITHESIQLQLPLPDSEVLGKTLDYVTGLYNKNDVCAPERESVLRAALGLTVMEAEMAFSHVIAEVGKIDSESIPSIMSRKRDAIRRSGSLDYLEPRYSMEDVGGLERLKEWLSIKKKILGEDARARNIPLPKGVLLTGVPGCGKSLVAEAIAKTWSLPLVRFDLGSVYQGTVGSSESNIREALKVADAVSPCVLFIDEIEKGLAGSGGSGNLDSGVALRVFGTILTWMNENDAGAFVVATANNLSNLPPELKRKGRFDEVFFIDYPDNKARQGIFEIHIMRREPNISDLDLNRLALITKDWTGAEIEAAVSSAIELSFVDGNRPLTMDDLENSISEIKPQHFSLKDDIEAMRKEADKIGKRASVGSSDDDSPDGGGNIYGV